MLCLSQLPCQSTDHHEQKYTLPELLATPRTKEYVKTATSNAAETRMFEAVSPRRRVVPSPRT
jgi:hypothetical protein